MNVGRIPRTFTPVGILIYIVGWVDFWFQFVELSAAGGFSADLMRLSSDGIIWKMIQRKRNASGKRQSAMM